MMGMEVTDFGAVVVVDGGADCDIEEEGQDKGECRY